MGNAFGRREHRQLRRHVFTIERRIAEGIRFLLALRPLFGCCGASHRRGIQDESFKFNHSHVFHSCIGGCVQRRKRPNGHETANAPGVKNRYESTTNGDRRSVDEFDRRSLDGIATQVMALAGSTLLWLGVPPCVGPGIRGSTVRRTRGARATCAIGLSSQCIRGSRAFSRGIDGLFSGGHAKYQLGCLG